MKRQLLEIYALAVCFFTVACFVIVAGMLLWDLVRLLAPDFTVASYVYEMHQSDAAYERSGGRYPGALPLRREQGEAPAQPVAPPPALSRAESWAIALHTERREGLRGIVRNAIIIFIDLLVFAAHWRIGRAARAAAA